MYGQNKKLFRNLNPKMSEITVFGVSFGCDSNFDLPERAELTQIAPEDSKNKHFVESLATVTPRTCL